MFPAGRSVLVWRETRDRYGDAGREGERWLHGVSIAPRVSTEAGGDLRTATVSTGLTMLVPGAEFDGVDGVWISAQHRVQVDDDVYRVQGRPAVWSSPLTGWAPGVQVELEAVEG